MRVLSFILATFIGFACWHLFVGDKESVVIKLLWIVAVGAAAFFLSYATERTDAVKVGQLSFVIFSLFGLLSLFGIGTPWFPPTPPPAPTGVKFEQFQEVERLRDAAFAKLRDRNAAYWNKHGYNGKSLLR